jgi:acetyl esterase/lipase
VNHVTDPWLAGAADFARVFVTGDSAGGNIAHHVAAAFGKAGLSPAIRIRGAVLLAPAMAGEARTRAEVECPPGAYLSTETCDKYCRLALPGGATRDHTQKNVVVLAHKKKANIHFLGSHQDYKKNILLWVCSSFVI